MVFGWLSNYFSKFFYISRLAECQQAQIRRSFKNAAGIICLSVLRSSGDPWFAIVKTSDDHIYVTPITN
jgi:hypothetical protein